MSGPIILYDGVCGLCNHFVQLVLNKDREAKFRFAPLQSALASRILTRHGINPAAVDTVYVVLNPDLTFSDAPTASSDETLHSRSDAVLFVLNELGGSLRFSAKLLRMAPKFLRDTYYNAIASQRYRIFGRSDVCKVPSDGTRERFLDL